MARSRSRRTHRRSASQTAASLLALALPAPVQRVADTRLGPLLMLVGVPTAIVAGLININWNGVTPSLSIDQQRAAEIRNVARDKFNNFESQGGLQNIGQAATDLLSQAQGYGSPNYNAPNYGQPTTYNPSATRNPSTAFPSTQPATQRPQQTAPASGHQYAQQDWRNYTPSTVTQHPTQHSTATGMTGYPTQTPNQSYSPSDTRTLTYQQQEQLYQQQLYQQQLQQQQQQLYDQQLKQYQYQQWLAQQTNAQPHANQTQPATAAYPATDAYGRPIATGYPQPNSASQYSTQPQYSQPTGQQNYNQGSLPAANSRGRY